MEQAINHIKKKYVYAYIHTYRDTYIHTYIDTYIHTYTHTYIHIYIHTYIHIHRYIHNHQAGGPTIVGCPQLIIQYIRSYPPYWRSLFHSQPDHAPFRGDRDPLIMVVYYKNLKT